MQIILDIPDQSKYTLMSGTCIPAKLNEVPTMGWLEVDQQAMEISAA